MILTPCMKFGVLGATVDISCEYLYYNIMIKTPVRGMRDFTPTEMILRDYVLDIIKSEAAFAGYQKIETPVLESLENLTSNQGGDNEKLIFKVLKRGQSLTDAQEKGAELADSGLRYDLTVPLARYFANNQKNLTLPFKTLQIGSVWRADKPQKGRYRQFVQCDMDVLGDSTILAEIDTITMTVKILNKIFQEANIQNLTININDRRILMAAIAFAGFPESAQDSVLIALDKADKIGFAGVREELLGFGYDESAVAKFVNLFDRSLDDLSVREFCQALGDQSPVETALHDLEKIISVLQNTLSDQVKIIFNPTIVRGMGYYTGPIFEYTIGNFGSSIGGGGRYDNMIGKISGSADVPACGSSIGFERIIVLLQEANFAPPENIERVAILIDRNISPEKLEETLARAAALRAQGKVASLITMNKNLKFQIDTLEQNGYTSFEKIYNID